MTEEYLAFVGTYTDPIFWGTVKIPEGKGAGIYVYRMDPDTGAMALIRTNTGITNPAYLAVDAGCRGLGFRYKNHESI